MAVQCISLAAYPAQYRDNSTWYVLATSFGPAVFLWLISLACKANLRWFFDVWYLYIICALIPNIAIIFFLVGDSVDKNKFLNQNKLKMVLCITPLLLLLLLYSALDSDRNNAHRELVSKLSFQMAIDLIDVVEMIDIVLEENEHHLGIPKKLGKWMVILACFSLLVSTGQLAEYKLIRDKVKIRLKTVVFRNLIQTFHVNLPFLIIRGVVSFKYGKDESIFIAKNGIGIIFSLLKIRRTCASPKYERLSLSDESDWTLI